MIYSAETRRARRHRSSFGHPRGRQATHMIGGCELAWGFNCSHIGSTAMNS